MIAFGSQRGCGADLATHLANAEDNECVERIEGRGSIADDTHGAFAEWETIAHAMTRCTNYMYSLSINPDPAQGPITHEQYMDYIERAEAKLGLHGQPREIYWHIKEDRRGELRDHYHCIWFRVDVQECRAIPISFDRPKLMMVSREWAHDHGLTLPDGYHTGKAKAQQLSLYDKAQMDQTGLSKQDRMDVITDLWRASDSAKAFVAGLQDHGYLLATGCFNAEQRNVVEAIAQNTADAGSFVYALERQPQLLAKGLTTEDRIAKVQEWKQNRDRNGDMIADLQKAGVLYKNRRPYVLVDVYGHKNALPRMIDDKAVRQKDVLGFLEKDYPPESLPTVDEAKEQAAAHYKERKALRKNEEHVEQVAILKRSQEKRAEKLQADIARLNDHQGRQREKLVLEGAEAHEALKKRQASEDFQINIARTQNAPKGIAGFFAKYTGISFVRSQLHRREDRLRENRQALEREKLAQEQKEKASHQTRLHQLQMMELRRKEKAQQLVFSREQRTLSRKHEQERAIAYRKGHEHMPAPALTLTPGGRRAMPHKAARRYTSPTAKELNVKARPRAEHEPVELRPDFTVAAKPPKKTRSGSSKSPGAEFKVNDKDRDGGKKR